MPLSTEANIEMIRVDLDDLVDEYPGYTSMTWKGKLFTGIGFEIADDGHMISETTYIEGAEDGLYKTWHWNGELESEGKNKWNRGHGFFKEWYESGRLKTEGLVELGIVIWRKEWDENGNSIDEYRIEDHPSKLEELAGRRNWAKNYESSYNNLS
jgi:hypothetical protein